MQINSSTGGNAQNCWSGSGEKKSTWTFPSFCCFQLLGYASLTGYATEESCRQEANSFKNSKNVFVFWRFRQ